MVSRGVGEEAPTAPACTTQRLVIPKKRSDGLSEAVLAELRAEFGSAPLPSSVQAPAVPIDAPPAPPMDTDLCPFCHEPMPKPMSPALRSLVEQWVQKSRAGKVLRPTDTLAVCQRHRDEHDIIPQGRRNGWPLELDFRALRKRITDPEHRYGEQGCELFADILHAAFVHDPLMPSLDLKHAPVLAKIEPLNALQFLDAVLLPELVCMLIQDDAGGEPVMSYDEARRVQRASRKFGIAMYPSDSGDLRKTRRASGGWLGASPHSEKRRRCSTGLVQQTLVAVRRSARIPESGPRVMLDPSDSEDEETPRKMHQQRLHLVRMPSAAARPAPRPSVRKEE
ncbi:hypothetical protein MBRA1_002425 [Malassezia brasiliensis]|uniref:Restriction of telomere capping protein 4 n=1 Tax=Malassezia brasiliensis TaxID=1821822 RepID=A0AAF0DVX3_9BASI|nr:hypothetical protein MBRA1_002425 [Malassezia brasiliensis]